MLKSKLSSFGSSCSQATGIRTVLTCIAASLGMIASAWAAVPADELPNSPPRIRKGRPFTMSWPVPFTIWMCGNSAAGRGVRERKIQANQRGTAGITIFTAQFSREVLSTESAKNTRLREGVVASLKKPRPPPPGWFRGCSSHRVGLQQTLTGYTGAYILAGDKGKERV